jgi:predicted methyltransferase
MKVRELKNFLELNMPEQQITKALTSFSHWVAAVFQAKEYVVGNPGDMEMLRKLERLGIVEIKKEKAALTKRGKELYHDFYSHGYY